MLTVNTGFCIFDLFLAAILVFGWAHTRPFFENSAEIERIVVSHSSSNFVDGFIGIIQIPFCCGNSQICNILHRRNLHDTFEAMNKPVRAHQVFFCILFNRYWFGIIIIEIMNSTFNVIDRLGMRTKSWTK